MGKVKRGRGGRSRWTKGNDSDDSDEDYLVEEDEEYLDEDKLYSNDEDDDVSDNEYAFEGKYEDDEFGIHAQYKRKRSGSAGMKLGKKVGNNKRNVRRRHNESDDENETWAERLQDAEEEEIEGEEEEEEKKDVIITKRKRSCLDQKKWRSKVTSNKRNARQEFVDKDYFHVEEVEEEDYKEEEDPTQNFEVSEEDEDIEGVTKSNLGESCLDQKILHTKTSKRIRHEKVDDEDYNFDDDHEEGNEDDEFTLDESFSLEEDAEEKDDDEDDEFTLDESFSLEEDAEEEDDDDDEDDEFMLDESFSLDENEEEHVVKRKKQNKSVIKRTSRKKVSGSRKKKRKVKTANRVVKKRKVSRSLRKNDVTVGEEDGDDCEDEDFTNVNIVKKITTKKPRRGTRNFTVDSDSDFVDSGPSENEFTISEEEREQVREAVNICRKSTLSSSSCSYKIPENESSAQRRKPHINKGKEKIPELKNEAVKQVCGICFTDEKKNTVRGVLDCCSHYFCFACIYEWSNVESRCPMCKQRFQAISKSAKVNTGVDVRDLVVQIPERDQVYQPTEEEIRGYLDPYESVICTECHEGGDDELMLLCDLCDSPAHTYCVGLGREVPEGNWYCEGCRPASLGSNNQVQDSITGQRNLFHRLSSFDGNRDDFDGPLSTPSTQFLQGFGSFPSPRYPSGSIQASSPRSGTGVVTVSGRRQMHRQMQSMLSNHRSRQATDVLIGDMVDTSQVNQNNSSHRTSSPTRMLEIGTSFRTQVYEESLNTPTQQNMQFLSVSSGQLEGQLVLDTIPVLSDINIPGTSRLSSISTSHNVQPIMFSGSSNVGIGNHPSSSALGEGINFYLEEQVKHLVQNYVTSMSSTLTISLDAGVLEEITRKSNNTILAACGRHHHPNEVFAVPPPPVCTHFENLLIPTSPLRDQCSSCFNTFIKEVVKTVMNSKLPSFLRVKS